MNTSRYILFFLSLFFPSLIFAQGYSASGGSLNQVTRMQATWFEDFKNKIKNSSNATQIENVYFDMDKGPYFNNQWYDAEIITNTNEVIEERIKVRFDTYQHNIHFTRDYRDIKAMETAQVKGFKLINGDKKHEFIKIYPSLNEYSPNFSYYEVLYNGEDYGLYQLVYSTLEVNNYMGPGSDGRARVSFEDHYFTYLKDKDGFYKKVTLKKKALANLFEDNKEKYMDYIRENGKIRENKDLVAFLNFLEN